MDEHVYTYHYQNVEGSNFSVAIVLPQSRNLFVRHLPDPDISEGVLVISAQAGRGGFGGGGSRAMFIFLIGHTASNFYKGLLFLGDILNPHGIKKAKT